jgi:hypothetical protein
MPPSPPLDMPLLELPVAPLLLLDGPLPLEPLLAPLLPVLPLLPAPWRLADLAPPHAEIHPDPPTTTAPKRIVKTEDHLPMQSTPAYRPRRADEPTRKCMATGSRCIAKTGGATP